MISQGLIFCVERKCGWYCCERLSSVGTDLIIHWGVIIDATMSTVVSIYILQQIDTKIDRSNERIRRIEIILADRRVVEQASEDLDKATDTMRSASQECTAVQGEIDIVTSKHESGEKRLYSGTVTNPKELKDLQDQGDALTRRIMELEDKKLNAMIVEEDCKDALEEVVRQYDTVVDERGVLQEELRLESKSLSNDTVKLAAEREVALNSIPVEVLGNYNNARTKYRGVAVVLVNDGMCSGCGMGVSTARIQAARGGDTMVNCDNCNRFLYVK